MVPRKASRSPSLNGAVGESQPEFLPLLTTSVCTPTFSRASPIAILPPTTPIEPVSVPGAATIRSAATAT